MKQLISVVALFMSINAGAATLAPVGSLQEVTPGDSYPVRLPPVENPDLFRGKRVAVLAGHGVMEVEILYPVRYLQARGATVEILGPSWVDGKILLVQYMKPTLHLGLDGTFEQGLKRPYDLVLVPGGAWSSQVVRSDAFALEILKRQAARGGLIAAICSGSQVLIDAGIARGRTLTGSSTIRADLQNAGARYIDEPAVVDQNLITSRNPWDLPDFVRAIGALLSR